MSLLFLRCLEVDRVGKFSATCMEVDSEGVGWQQVMPWGVEGRHSLCSDLDEKQPGKNCKAAFGRILSRRSESKYD